MKVKIGKLTRYEKFKLLGLIIKSISGVIGGSLILTESHPYWTLGILGLGAAANEVVSFFKDKENNINIPDNVQN